MSRLFLSLFLIFNFYGLIFAGDDRLGFDSSRPAGRDFFEPFDDLHFTETGTPLVHSFSVEPAFTGRGLFFDYHFHDTGQSGEHEIESELEWALTRRFGFILEVPHAFENGNGGDSRNGFGDIAIAPRVMLIEKEHFLLTTQVEVVIPTGTNGYGGETAIAPGFAIWNDLGNWWTLNSRLAVEHIFNEDSTDLLFGFGLIKSFEKNRADSGKSSHFDDHHEILFNLHMEVTGMVGLAGENEGRVISSGLMGASFGLNEETGLRLGYEFPITSPQEFNGGVTAGIIKHF